MTYMISAIISYYKEKRYLYTIIDCMVLIEKFIFKNFKSHREKYEDLIVRLIDSNDRTN